MLVKGVRAPLGHEMATKTLLFAETLPIAGRTRVRFYRISKLSFHLDFFSHSIFSLIVTAVWYEYKSRLCMTCHVRIYILASRQAQERERMIASLASFFHLMMPASIMPIEPKKKTKAAKTTHSVSYSRIQP